MINMNKRKILTYICSFLFSLAFVISIQILKYFKSSSIVIGQNLHFDIFVIIEIIILSIVFYFIFKHLLIFISKKEIPYSKKEWNNKKVFIFSFITIFFSGLVFLLTFYPGVAMVDSFQLILDPVNYSFQYPLIYSLITSKLFYLFYEISGSMNIAFFILSFMQLIFMSFIISWVIKWQHKLFKSNILTFLTILYFNLFIIFSNLNVAHLRDSLFSVFFLLIVTILIDLVRTKGNILNDENCIIKLIISITGLLISRNNGLFIVIVLLIYFIIKYRKYYKINLLLLSITIFVSFVPRILPNNFKNLLFQESVAVPFQQISYTIMYGNISDEDKNIISEIISPEIIKTKYSGYTFDRLKWGLVFNNFELNNKKKEFMEIWLRNFIPNYKTYTVAYVLNTCDLWALLPFKYAQGTFNKIDKKDLVGMQFFGELQNKRILPSFIQKILENIYENYNLYYNNGMLFWVYVFLFLALIYKNKKKYAIVFLPFALIWINLMLMTPLASAFRYMAMFGYSLPFIVGLVFSNKKISD